MDENLISIFSLENGVDFGDDYSKTSLPDWLALDLWTSEDALYILSGVEPGSMEKPSSWASEKMWRRATVFRFSQKLELERYAARGFGSPESEIAHRLDEEDRERLRPHYEAYRRLSHLFEHSLMPFGEAVGSTSAGVARYRPEAAIAWAESIGHRPDWMGWANREGCLSFSKNIMLPPFFDADAPDYPYLLAVAVRTWEHARKSDIGTPKQRALDFLKQNYPNLSNEAQSQIAYIVNWQRAGGRPRQSD